MDKRDKELREFFLMESEEFEQPIEGTPANNPATWFFIILMIALIIAAVLFTVF